MKIFLVLLAVLLSGTIIYQTIKTQKLIEIGKNLSKNTTAYSQNPEKPAIEIIFMGDSSAVGVGAKNKNNTVAGYLGSDYPNAKITNKAISGLKVNGLLEEIKKLDQTSDLLILHIGGNDIVRFTDLKQLEKDLFEIAQIATKKSKKVIMLNGGNVGSSKLLPFGTRWIFTLRTKKLRSIYLDIQSQTAITYIDMFRKGQKDPFVKNPQKYYSPDFFHPSGEGYKDWYQQIKKFL